jgi:dipeptidase E
MSKRNLLLLSNSTLHPTGYLEYAQDIICEFLRSANVKQVLFVPYALRDQDGYGNKVKSTLTPWGFKVSSIHEAEDPKLAVKKAEAIFIGGGNTFQLLKGLYDNQLVEIIRSRVLDDGVPYIGSSAGTNVSTISINTTNDMPIVYPPSFNALELVPFNINPHYIDTDPDSTHKGETREERLLQYHEIPDRPPVLALREGSILRVQGETAKLLGTFNARLFVPGKAPEEFPPDQDFSFLMKK